MTIVLSEAAEEELRGATTEYDHISVRVRQKFSKAVRAALRLIRNTPELFGWYEGGGRQTRFRRVMVKGFPYLIVYEVLDDKIEVAAFAHTSREPGYWERR